VKQRKTFLLVSGIALATVVGLAAGGAEAMSRGLYRLVGVVGQIVALVRSSYVEEVPVERLELGALGGLVDAADPGGAWVPEEHAEAYAAALDRGTPAFGIALGRRASYPYVLQVVPGSPAAMAGVKAGEYIERIGAEPVRARPLWLAVVLLDRAAEQRETVTIDVIDRAIDGKRQVSLEPGGAPSLAPAVDGGHEVPVLRFVALERTAVEEAQRALAAIEGALVVDLRGTALGRSAAAVEAASMLVGGEIEAPRQRKNGATPPLRATGPERRRQVTVCIDGTTAGAAEVLASLLKRRGGTLVGTETYGDTGVRQPQPVAGGQLWLAAEWFLSPDGSALLGSGLKPDETVRPRGDTDTVLDRALELARGQSLPKAA